MKKVMSFLLAALLLVLCACGASESAPTETTTVPAAASVQVGFGEGDITPDWPIGLQGYGNEATRISTGL